MAGYTRLALPVVTLIDTAGADGAPEAQVRNVAGEIAETLAEFVGLAVPTMAVVVGTGASGGAMALAAADRVVMDETATFHVLTAEMTAQLLLGDADRAFEIRPRLTTGASDLTLAGFADRMVNLRDPMELRSQICSFLEAPPPASSRKRRWELSNPRGDI